MNYEYCEARKREMNPYVYIRLKYERKYYRCEYYDGMRILFDSIPQGKHRYETRHSETNICIPVPIKPESVPVIVNFCGTIVSNIPIEKNEETKVMVFLFTGESYGDVVVGEDIVFDSPSGAASFCVGGASNGWRDWMDENKNELVIYRK